MFYQLPWWISADSCRSERVRGHYTQICQRNFAKSATSIFSLRHLNTMSLPEIRRLLYAKLIWESLSTKRPCDKMSLNANCWLIKTMLISRLSPYIRNISRNFVDSSTQCTSGIPVPWKYSQLFPSDSEHAPAPRSRLELQTINRRSWIALCLKATHPLNNCVGVPISRLLTKCQFSSAKLAFGKNMWI